MSYLPTFRNLSSFMDDIDHTFSHSMRKLFDDAFSRVNLHDFRNKFKDSGYPRVDVFTDQNQFCIDATVPGVKDEDLTVEMGKEGETPYVKISGKRTLEDAKETAAFSLKEIRSTKFARVIALPPDLDSDPTAEMVDGILKLRWEMPKAKTETTRLIPLKKA